MNKQHQNLITAFFLQNVAYDGQGEEEEGGLDDVDSVVSSLDFGGFLEEVEYNDTVGGENSGVPSGRSISQLQKCLPCCPHASYYNTLHKPSKTLS